MLMRRRVVQDPTRMRLIVDMPRPRWYHAAVAQRSNDLALSSRTASGAVPVPNRLRTGALALRHNLTYQQIPL
jgi:hypothetical protein